MVLYPSMVDMSIHIEGQTENVALVRAVPHQERPIRLIQELDLRLIPAERTPVPTTLTKVIEKIRFYLFTVYTCTITMDKYYIVFYKMLYCKNLDTINSST